jgi:carbon storage regulator CsrA
MLVLSRRESDQVCFGDNIELTVVAISGNQVRIGVKAPRDVRILRTELRPSSDTASDGDPVAV